MAPRSLPRLSQRIALLGSTLLVAFIIAVGGAAWLIIRADQARAHQQLVEQELEAEASRVGSLLATLHGELREVARSSLLSTALVDSAGRDAYLVPYLQGLRRVYGVPVSLVFTDFEGKEIARNGAAGVNDEDFQWVQRVLEDPKKPRATLIGSGAAMALRVVEPIFYSRTPAPEGALLYRINLADLTDGTGLLGPLPALQDQPRKAGVAIRRVPAPPELSTLDLSLSLHRAPVRSLPAGDLLTLLVTATLAATLLAVWATRRMAAHLTEDLGKLVTFASDVSRGGLEAQGHATGETQDVRQLADALNVMLDQLRRQHQLLQEESEAKYRSLVENLPGAAYRCAARNEPELAYVSRGIEALTGYAANEFTDPPCRSYTALIHPDDRAIRRPAQGQRFNIWEYRITDADGKERWIWERNQRRHIAGDEHDSLEGVLFDITDRKRVEQSLLQATRTAETANLAKSQFLATMSHELRTPLSGILGMAELMLLPELSPEERIEHSRTILQSGQMLLAQLNDILDLSRIEAGRLELRHVPFYPARLAQDVATLFAASAQRKLLDLRCDTQLPADATYLGDPVRLRQMLSNFVSNALKFTDEGHVSIEVEELTLPEGSVLEFRVTDTGIGVPEDKIPDLFAPFSQIDTSNTRRHGGTGLGLSIVQSLATAMGGSVGVTSKSREGARFWFRIPAQRRSTGGEELSGRFRMPDAEAKTVDRVPAPANPADANYEVLLVDDNAMIRRVIESMLKHAGIRCTSVTNGNDAMTRITSDSPPNLVLMDCQMPEMDGFETTARIRGWERVHSRKRIPIIALTAAAFEQDRERCLASGMDDFLAKPVTMRDLIRAITAQQPTSAGP